MTNLDTTFPIGSFWIYTAPHPLVLFRLEQLFTSGAAESVWTTELSWVPDPTHPEVNALTTQRDKDHSSVEMDILGRVVEYHDLHGQATIVLEITAPLALDYWTRQPVTLQVHIGPARLHQEWTQLS